MIKLKQIAELTNVSVSTVSRVLSDKGKIGAETRKKVLAALEELALEPGVLSPALPGLMATLAIYLPPSGEFYQDDPSSSQDVRSLLNECKRFGVTPEVFYQHGPRDNGDIVKQFELRGVTGVIISDPLLDNPSLDAILASGLPYLITNGHFRHSPRHFVDFDNYDGACQVTDHLLARGHRQLAVITGPAQRLVSANRLDGVTDALARAGLPLRPELVCPAEFSLEGGYAAMQRLLSTSRDYTAVLAFSDFIAMGAMKAIREHGLSIPRDLSITGFDNIKIANFCDPPLTTVNRFSKEISPLLVKTLQDLIRFGDVMRSVQITLKTDLVERQSVRPI